MKYTATINLAGIHDARDHDGRIFAKPSRSALEIIRKVEAEVTP